MSFIQPHPLKVLLNSAPDALSNNWRVQYTFPAALEPVLNEIRSQLLNTLEDELDLRTTEFKLAFPSTEIYSYDYKGWSVETQAPSFTNTGISLNVSFRCDEKFLFYKLFFSFWSLYRDYRQGYSATHVPAEARGKIVLITGIDGVGTAKEWTLHNVWLSDIGDLSFDRDNSTPISFSLTFRATHLEENSLGISPPQRRRAT